MSKNPLWDNLSAIEKMETTHAGRQFSRRLIPTLAGTSFVLLTTDELERRFMRR